MKAKATVGIALGLWFAPSLRLLHAAVKAGNFLFDADWRIQIAEFSSIRLETGEMEPFWGEVGSAAADVSVFASLLFEIAVGRPATLPIGSSGCTPFPAAVPTFVSRLIKDRRSHESAQWWSIVCRNCRMAEGEQLRNHSGR
jgi:hypothetical protein